MPDSPNPHLLRVLQMHPRHIALRRRRRRGAPRQWRRRGTRRQHSTATAMPRSSRRCPHALNRTCANRYTVRRAVLAFLVRTPRVGWGQLSSHSRVCVARRLPPLPWCLLLCAHLLIPGAQGRPRPSGRAVRDLPSARLLWLFLALSEALLAVHPGLLLRVLLLLLVLVRAAGPPLLEPLDQRHVQHDHIVVLLARACTTTTTAITARCCCSAHPSRLSPCGTRWPQPLLLLVLLLLLALQGLPAALHASGMLLRLVLPSMRPLLLALLLGLRPVPLPPQRLGNCCGCRRCLPPNLSSA